MPKNLVPCILFNDKEYKYPKGIRIIDLAKREEMLDSGEWLCGPGKPPGKQKEPDVFQCPYCDFKTEHEPSLKAHITKNHKNIGLED